MFCVFKISYTILTIQSNQTPGRKRPGWCYIQPPAAATPVEGYPNKIRRFNSAFGSSHSPFSHWLLPVTQPSSRRQDHINYFNHRPLAQEVSTIMKIDIFNHLLYTSAAWMSYINYFNYFNQRPLAAPRLATCAAAGPMLS